VDDNERIRISERIKDLAGRSAIGLLAAAVGASGVLIFDNYTSVMDHNAQFARVWTPELHRQITDDLRIWRPEVRDQLDDAIKEINNYISVHEQYKSIYSEQDRDFKANVRALMDARASECVDNWARIDKRLRELEKETAVLKSKIDKPWSLSK
jgi:dihydroneopterin aldolase